jgi:dynactin complex subunit
MSYANINVTREFFEIPIAPFLKSFIEKLALKHPNWMFIAYKATHLKGDVSKTQFACGFKVVEKRETIGKIDFIHTRGKEAFSITNRRIKDKRERGDSITTSDEKKAIRHIDKWFYRETVKELMDKQVGLANRKSYEFMNTHRDGVKHSWSELEEPMKRFIVDNYDAFLKTLYSPKLVEIASIIHTTIEHAEAAIDIHDKLMANNAFVITILETGNYAIQKGMDISVKSSEELDSDMRRKLGMLKLIAVEQGVAGVGLKCSDDTFVVI